MRHPGVSIYRRFSIKEPYEESYFFLERAFDSGLALAFAGIFFFVAAFFFLRPFFALGFLVAFFTAFFAALFLVAF